MDTRRDLGELLHRLTQTIVGYEKPILEAAGVDMWDYVILSRLAGGAAPTQSQLAASTGRDKTRLIGNLDRLEKRGLLTRAPDPSDRRNRIVTLTDDGRTLLDHCITRIRAMEDNLFTDIAPADRATFVAVLDTLTPR